MNLSAVARQIGQMKHVTAETEEDISWTLDGEYAPGAPRIEIGIEENGITMLL